MSIEAGAVEPIHVGGAVHFLHQNQENHLETREVISSLSGLQMRYNLLDHEGVARAKKMRRLRASGRDDRSWNYELHDLRKEHHLQNLISECRLRRKHICAALREGGACTLAKGLQPVC